jgi:hypothetical protein
MKTLLAVVLHLTLALVFLIWLWVPEATVGVTSRFRSLTWEKANKKRTVVKWPDFVIREKFNKTPV